MLFIIKTILNLASGLQFNPTQKSDSQKTFEKYSYGKIYKSNDGKCILQQITQNHRDDIIAIYKIIHEDGNGSITVKLCDINKYKIRTQEKILYKAEIGNLNRAEGLIKKHKNMDIDKYTHRLSIFNKKNTQQRSSIYSIIDLRLRTNSSNDEYNNHYTKKIFFLFLAKLINKPYRSNYEDAIICLLKESWDRKIIQFADQFYKSKNYPIDNLSSKIIYCRSKNYE
ncbi:MAG: hypothetical protein QNJ18_01175 [Xenococcaceae cyanobacterium MO_167.B52]|nr:hypothetical protein [Xenococcaceae cyanobacterium MO_167.B52]